MLGGQEKGRENEKNHLTDRQSAEEMSRTIDKADDSKTMEWLSLSS